jgi:hypothetical protein
MRWLSYEESEMQGWQHYRSVQQMCSSIAGLHLQPTIFGTGTQATVISYLICCPKFAAQADLYTANKIYHPYNFRLHVMTWRHNMHLLLRARLRLMAWPAVQDHNLQRPLRLISAGHRQRQSRLRVPASHMLQTPCAPVRWFYGC